MPIQRIQHTPLPFAGKRHTPDTARMQALYLRLGEDLASIGMRKGANTAAGLQAMGALYSNYRGEKRAEAATAAAAEQRRQERDAELKFRAAEGEAERKARAAEKAADAALRAEERKIAAGTREEEQLEQVLNKSAGVQPVLYQLAEKFPALKARFQIQDGAPVLMNPESVEKSLTRKREADRDKTQDLDRVEDNKRADAQLRISQQVADTGRIQAETTRQRYTGGGVDTAKLGPLANVLDRAILTITPNKRGPILALAHRYADEGNTNALKEVIQQAAIENEPVATKDGIRARRATVAALKDAQTVLAEMKQAGVPSNVMTGTAEDIARKLGTSTDPRYVAFATQLQDTLINYRRAATGAAFGEKEGADYARMFPNYRQTFPVNEATIKGLMRSMETTDKEYWRGKLGEDGVKAIFGEPAATADPLGIRK